MIWWTFPRCCEKVGLVDGAVTPSFFDAGEEIPHMACPWLECAIQMSKVRGGRSMWTGVDPTGPHISYRPCYLI